MKSSAPRATINKADAPAAGQGVAMVDNRAVAVAQRQALAAIDNSPRQVAQRQQAAAAAPPRNTTGLPDNLKARVENLSGYSLDDVKVHYNSAQPAQLQAHAYAQGTDIHVAPGQEKHLPHEAWHVVQQKQGRVKPTVQMKNGIAINDDKYLEAEAESIQSKLIINDKYTLSSQRNHQFEQGDITESATRDFTSVMQQKKNSIPYLSSNNASNNLIQCYDMTYGALHNGCGTDMHVLIKGHTDPDYGKGSVPSVVPAWWPAAGTVERAYFQQYVVQGHLLNQELGGPGNTMSNLTPITKSTNSTHYHNIEKAVKTEVKIGNWVEYRVQADYSSHPSIADFGAGAPATLAPLLLNFAGSVGADYTVYDSTNYNVIGGMPGVKHIKNEGKHMKGVFV